MKRILASVFIILLFVLFAKPEPAFALKKRIRAARAVYSSAKLSRGSHSVVVTFYALPGVAKFDYTLSYSANGIPQGVVGAFPVTAGNDSRDLYFGTCSKGVCTPHYGITGATLTVTATLKGGATYIKRYAIKNV
jgi:hypothetical protein